MSCQQSGQQPVLVAIIVTDTEKLLSLCEVHYKKVLAASTAAAVGSLERSIQGESLLKGGKFLTWVLLGLVSCPGLNSFFTEE